MAELLVGNSLLAFFSKYQIVYTQDSEDEESLISVLNLITPDEAESQISNIVTSIKSLQEYVDYETENGFIDTKVLTKIVRKAINACKAPSTTSQPKRITPNRLGDYFFNLLSSLVDIPTVKESCCTFRKTLNTFGPKLSNDNMLSLIVAAKCDKLYSELELNLPDRTIYLFIRKAIRMTGVDMKKLRKYHLTKVSRKKVTNDATQKR
jgi:hypothetical protein